ncbi:hypothetical protein V8D89_003651 [Ganoderma adspersum]
MDSYADGIRFPTCKVCDCCGRPRPTHGGELKKCGGCSAVLYCSKQCQTEVWRFHKYVSLKTSVYLKWDLCRSSKSKEEAAELGYSSLASVATALKRWASAHTWALQTMIEAIVHKTGGGIDDHLKNQHAIVFVLLQGRPNPNDPNNPAKVFYLDNGGLPALESQCNNMAVAMHASLPEPEQHMFAGFINVVFHFLPAGMTSFHHYPVYRLCTHGGGPSYNHPTTDEERMLSNDIVQICSWYANQGLALRAPGDDYNRQPLPEVGSYKREKKT